MCFGYHSMNKNEMINTNNYKQVLWANIIIRVFRLADGYS